MENIQQKWDNWQDRLDSRWRQLPRLRRRRIILYSFACYMLITLAIVLEAIYKLDEGQEKMDIQHIHNAVARDIIKEKKTEIQKINREQYERK